MAFNEKKDDGKKVLQVEVFKKINWYCCTPYPQRI